VAAITLPSLHRRRQGAKLAARAPAAAAVLVVLLATVAAAAAAGPRVPRFRHVLIVVFENKERDQIVGSPAAPTFAALARRYASMTAYDAVAHPSLPNYLALVSGSTQGIQSDCTSCLVDAPNLADELDHAGLTWKTYAEGLPTPGFTRAAAGLYAKKHDPFLYFTDVADRPARRNRVVPFSQLRPDLAAGHLPDYALIVPNLCHDMHDCPVSIGDHWLREHIVPLLRRPQLADSVVFLVFDEGSTDTGGGGRIAALALGPLVRPGAQFLQPTSHYGLLRTIEDAWRLPPLGKSAQAKPITGIWR
jgi:phospholipase C